MVKRFGMVLAAATLIVLAMPASVAGQATDEPAPRGEAITAEIIEAMPTCSGLDVFMDREDVGPNGPVVTYGMRQTCTGGDPRLAGDVTLVLTGEYGDVRTGSAEVVPEAARRYTAIERIENADGAWQGPLVGVALPGDIEIRLEQWLKGEGAYEGLYLFTSFRGAPDGSTGTMDAMIWHGPPPAFPDASLLTE